MIYQKVKKPNWTAEQIIANIDRSDLLTNELQSHFELNHQCLCNLCMELLSLDTLLDTFTESELAGAVIEINKGNMSNKSNKQGAKTDNSISPEEQLRNSANYLKEIASLRRKNGKGKSYSYVGTVDDIAWHGSHLADMVIKYLDGNLKPAITNEDPF